MAYNINEKLFSEAKDLIPGGVNSPVRAFGQVGGCPAFIKRGRGAKVWDEEDKEYIDYVGSWGALILGHSHPRIVEVIREVVQDGTSFGAPTRKEVEFARTIIQAVPSIQMLRMVNSGTEAVMSAIRLARGYTGRNKVIKFAGCYHGHVDYLLVSAGSGAAAMASPDSLGVPRDFAQHTLVLPYNNLDAVNIVTEKLASQIAAIVVEPVAGNMGVVPPESEFLKGLRMICDRHGIVLIFDEVITGFRVSYGGAQELYGIKPDLTCLGKIIGGGFPVGAYGGKKEIMSYLAPVGEVYQAGTLSGNPVAVQAGLETLKILSHTGIYKELDEKTSYLCEGIQKKAEEAGIEIKINRVGSMFSLFFTSQTIKDFEGVKNSRSDLFRKFFWGMLKEGIYLPPSPFESNFVSVAHTKEDIQRTIEIAGKVFQRLI